MPEGPELYITASFINKICKGLTFGGPAVRNPIHKCSEIDWDEQNYKIRAESRGKEMMLHLRATGNQDRASVGRNKEAMLHQRGSHDDADKTAPQPAGAPKATYILFTFGMSGRFAFTPSQQLLKHSHLTFYTRENPPMALSFVDSRRFGKWTQDGQWSPHRGPCAIQEFNSFVENIVASLDDAAFKKPVCELMLDQRFFNGIGNYLRAEILFRCKVPPFVRADTVLQFSDVAQARVTESQNQESHIEIRQAKRKTRKKGSGSVIQPGNVNVTAPTAGHNGDDDVSEDKDKTKQQAHVSSQHALDKLTPNAQKLLMLCHSVQMEVVQLGSSKYMLPNIEGQDQVFENWLQCYNKAGMKCLTDHNKRTIWFSGPSGPLIPRDSAEKPKKSTRGDKTKQTNRKKNRKKTEVNQKKTGVNSRKKTEAARKREHSQTDSDNKVDEEVLTDKIRSEKPGTSDKSKKTSCRKKSGNKTTAQVTEDTVYVGRKCRKRKKDDVMVDAVKEDVKCEDY